jgi:hypothetical protein
MAQKAYGKDYVLKIAGKVYDPPFAQRAITTEKNIT